MPVVAETEEPSLGELMRRLNVGPSELAREMSVTPMAVFYACRRPIGSATRRRYILALERVWAGHSEAVEELVAEGSRLLAAGDALTALVGLGASE
jgi:hypothetical protein